MTRDPQLTSPEQLLTAAAPTLESTRSSAADDPIAAELVLIARREVAARTGLPERRIRLVDVEAVRWSDSSLGCPQPEQTYIEMAIDGYRIVLEAESSTYIYHTDFDRLIACDETS